jgi:decaprenylphospho-beta-D-erythro-pentofuranosid-2-ulose 2-reductase
MNLVILGATKGMGRALARHCAERGDRLFLLGRSAEDLTRSVADLALRGSLLQPQVPPPGSAICDLERGASFAPALDAAQAYFADDQDGQDGRNRKIDAIVVTAGLFGTQAQLEADPVLCERVLRVNFVATVQFCEEARKRLLAQGGGTLCVFSSVAGDRARKPVVLYGASKAGLSAYLDGIDHKFHSQGLRVLCVRPGFIKTGMTAGLTPPPFAGEPGQVATEVRRALLCRRGPAVMYTPRIWGLVMATISALPRGVMRRINF